MNKPIHREEYIENWKHVYCIRDRVNHNWVTTNDDSKVTCGNCLKVIRALDKIVIKASSLTPDVNRAVKFLKRRKK
jgi:hypothetical protein